MNKIFTHNKIEFGIPLIENFDTFEVMYEMKKNNFELVYNYKIECNYTFLQLKNEKNLLEELSVFLIKKMMNKSFQLNKIKFKNISELIDKFSFHIAEKFNDKYNINVNVYNGIIYVNLILNNAIRI